MSLHIPVPRAGLLVRMGACVVALLMLTSGVTSAQTPSLMSGYFFEYRTDGSLTDMSSGYTQLIGSGVDDSRSTLQNISFTFNFASVNYTQFSASSNGVIALGSTLVSTTTAYSLSTTPRPWIASTATDQITRSNGVRMKVLGSAPNRILVVQWDVYRYSTSTSTAMHEIRLYEGTNEIQLVYGPSAAGVTNWTGRVGAVAAQTNYMLVNTTTNTTSTSGDITSNTRFPASGTVYRFYTCTQNISIAGNTSQGAQTVAMNNGASIFATDSVQRGNSATFSPFTITNGAQACGTRTFTYAITGPAAGDYQISTSGGTLLAGQSNTPTITFTPQGTGVRPATLLVTDNGSPQFARTYPLLATGTPRFAITGDIAQGGTALMASGDTLMQQSIVFHGECANFTPFSLGNTNTNLAAPALTYSMAIDSAGVPSTQYQIITPTSGTLAPGGTIVPTIRFCPAATNVGPQEARLVITTSDGDNLTYRLLAIAGAPTATFVIDGVQYTMGDGPIFRNVTTCVGEQAWSLPVVITNIGVGELIVRGFDVYRTDTTDRQGTPELPLVRDARGRPVRIGGYVLSTQPGVVPIGNNTPVTLPFSLFAGQSRTVYLTYVGLEPGRQFGRAYIRTNAENFAGVDTNFYDGVTTMPTTTLGLMQMDFVGRSVGSTLAADLSGARLKTLIFPGIPVGDTVTSSFTVANPGACDLRIARNALRIYSGDVNEFTLMSVLANARFEAATGDYVLAPGQVDSIVVRFVPSRSGTRMATLRFRTNDSTLGIAGLSERGTHLVDLQGQGRAGLDSRDLVLDPVVIGSSTRGVATLENSSNAAVEILSIEFIGEHAAEFSEDGVVAWPARPFNVIAGAKLNLGVRLSPTGNPGMRQAQLLLVTTGNDSIRVNIRGEAGTQQLVITPTSLFDDVQIPAGSVVHRMVMISNAGTLPFRLEPPTITGPDAANYRLGMMPRLDLEPGSTEYLEVTFAPEVQGQSSALLTITPVGGTPQDVTLGGIALRIRRLDIDPTNAAGTIDPAEHAGDRNRQNGNPTNGGSTLR